MRYEHLKDVPEQFRPVVQKLVEVGIILGSGEDGDGLVIDLSHDMVRMLVYGHRGGAFDRRFIQMGVDPVIPVTQK